MQALVCIFNGWKKNQTGKAYYFHEGEHLVKFKYDKTLLKCYYNKGEKQAWSSTMCKIILRQCVWINYGALLINL